MSEQAAAAIICQALERAQAPMRAVMREIARVSALLPEAAAELRREIAAQAAPHRPAWPSAEEAAMHRALRRQQERLDAEPVEQGDEH